MRPKLIKDISASTIQVLLNQALGLAIFYITSRWLAKELFGELNWSLAISSLLISMITAGTDMIVLRRIARGNDIRETAGLHFIHTLYTGVLLTGLLLSLYLLLPSLYITHLLLPGILLSQVLSFFASPFRQVANGTRTFSHLAIISTVANVVKLCSLIVCLSFDLLTSRNLLLIFIVASLAELFIAIFLTLRKNHYKFFPLYWDNKKYHLLLKESLPQYGVSIFNIVIARFDWILLGLLASATTVMTAEYSFAYKAVELSRLPLLIISPVLIPIFTKIFRDSNLVSSKQQAKLNLLFHSEMALAVVLPLLLASCWTPLMGGITDHKYGAVNETTFLILSVCVPIQYATDYYWNLCFAQGKLKFTLMVSVYSGIINIGLNLLLIPLYGGIGAACAYLGCFIVQLILFSWHAKQMQVKPDLLVLVKAIVCAAAAFFTTRYFIYDPVVAVFASLLLYLVFTFLTGLLVLQKIRPALRLFLTR
jgi:O-antigen/teichoic acid export membrane protein